MKSISKWLIRTLIFILSLALIYIAVPAFPHPLFNYKIEYKNFTFYSDQKFPANFNIVISEVETRINNLEVYDTSFSPNIFLCNDKSLYDFFAFWVRINDNSQAFNLSLLNNTFVNLSKVNYLNYYHDQRLKYTHLNGELSQVVAHELVHNLDCRFVGFSNYIDKPSWKTEGYAEYGSTIKFIEQDEKYDLFTRASFFFENDLFNAPHHSKMYYKYQLMIEYLFTKEGYGFELLSKKEINEFDVFEKLKSWYELEKAELKEQI